jgi:hypothetical protein
MYLPTKHVFFTRNGVLMVIACQIKANELIFPSIGMFGVGQIEVNLGESKFEFSLSNLKDQFETEDIYKVRGKRYPSHLRDFECDFSDEEEIPKKKKKKKK